MYLELDKIQAAKEAISLKPKGIEIFGKKFRDSYFMVWDIVSKLSSLISGTKIIFGNSKETI